MTTINDIVSVTVTAESSAVEKATFSVPLVVGYHTAFAERVREYSSLDGLVSDGFATTNPIYKACAALFAQTPRVAKVKVGRLALAPTVRFDLTPTAANSTVYKIAVNGTEYSYTSDSSATVAEICAGLVAAMGTISGLTITDNTSSIRIVASVAGNRCEVDNLTLPGLLAVDCNHADPGIATDLAAIALEDGAFYGIVLTTSSEAEINAAGAWALSNKKMLFAASPNTAILTNSTSDVASDLSGTSNERAVLAYHPRASQHAGAAIAGVLLASDPGAITLKFKPLAGVSTYKLTDTQSTYAKTKLCNVFEAVAGVSMLSEGVTAKAGKFADAVRDVDALEADIKESVLGLLARVQKVPFTDKGIAQIEAEVRGALIRAQAAGILADEPFTLTVPKALSVSANDRASRTLRTIKFTARGAGAIHGVVVNGVVSV